SSRRRHTRFSRDWSSDVCSSDLAAALCGLVIASGKVTYVAIVVGAMLSLILLQMPAIAMWLVLVGALAISGPVAFFFPALEKLQIGRASCRERVQNTVGSGARTR